MQLLETLTDRFLHLKSKLFRGKLIQIQETTYGRASVYESGYVEFVDFETGERSEPLRDIHFIKHAWRVTSTDGSTVSIGRYRRAQALREADKVVGRVLYVDDTNKIIFCKADK